MIREWADLSGYILDDGCGLGTYLEAFSPFTPHRFGLEVELDRAVKALPTAQGIVQAVGEAVPFPNNTFDFILSNEVIEHVDNDRQTLAEMVRILKPGGRIIIFCPNRWYPVEQHGIFWRGRYKFGNIPLVNYLPNPLRNKLAPHVRTYSAAALRRLYRDLPVRPLHHSRIFGGYDNIENRWPRLGRLLKKTLYTLEKTPFSLLGISHFLVLEKTTEV
jgi:SAM-dependent methyltransferase